MVVRSTSGELRLFSVGEEQRTQWDAFVAAHPQGI